MKRAALLVIAAALVACAAPGSVPCGDGWCAAGLVCEEGTCRGLTNCGNGKLEAGEECDEGAGNSREPNRTCRLDCTLRRCGDGVVDTLVGPEGQPAEACDEGAKNSDVDPNHCRERCVEPSCGDGVVDTMYQDHADETRGCFQPAVPVELGDPPAGLGPLALRARDLNLDGAVDLVAYRLGDGSFTISTA